MPDALTAGRKLAIAAPRGFAKSTLCSLLLPLWAVCFNQRHFILLISNTHAQAVKFLHALKTEFEVNAALQQAFPLLVPNVDKWSEDELELSCGTERYKLLAMGSGAQLRGLKFLQYRPDLIILDDVENDELVDSESRRNDLQWWLDHVVLYANPDAWIVMIGTILHEQALLNKLIRHAQPADARAYSDWTTRCFAARDAATSAWADFLSTERLDEAERRDPGGFQQEMMNEPFAAGYQPFRPEFFGDARWWTTLPEELVISITVDPACTDAEASDETAICTAGWDAQGRLWVLDLVHGKWTDPSDTLEQIFTQYATWRAACDAHPGWRFHCVGIEKNAFQRYLIHLFHQLCRSRGVRPYVKELTGDVRKVRRIWQLEPLFREHRIFLRPDLTALEVQLRSFRIDGKYAHDDLCLAAGTQIATRRGNVSIEHMRVGDEALTPIGFRPVLATGYTGHQPIIEQHGVRGTGNHPMFVQGRGFLPLDTLAYHDKIDTLSWSGLTRWAYRQLLNGMASPTASWVGRDAITLASQQLILDDSIRRDCMWRCGKWRQDGQCRQAMSFITKTAIRFIITLATWSVYRWQSIVGFPNGWIWKRIGATWSRFEDWLCDGIALMKGVVGIGRMPDGIGSILGNSTVAVGIAGSPFTPFTGRRNSVPALVNKPPDAPVDDGISQRFARSVLPTLSKTATVSSAPAPITAGPFSPIAPVYNLTVADAGCYYANGVLVSNCDALAYHVQLGGVLPTRLAVAPSLEEATALTFGEYARLSQEQGAYRRRFPDVGTRIAAGRVQPWYWAGN